jgi:uncharacterized glyoxalase superfamily protein PhnB
LYNTVPLERHLRGWEEGLDERNRARACDADTSPYVLNEDAEAALEWLARVFGFAEGVRYLDAERVLRAAEMYAGDTLIHLDGVDPGYWEGQGVGGPVGQLVIVYVNDVDAHHERAVSAGIAPPEPEDMFYGARTYTSEDPGGITWTFWQHLHDEVDLPDGWEEIRT